MNNTLDGFWEHPEKYTINDAVIDAKANCFYIGMSKENRELKKHQGIVSKVNIDSLKPG